MRLIDADALHRELVAEMVKCVRMSEETKMSMSERVLNTLDESPTIEADPVKHGRWVYDENGCDWNIGAWVCSECGSKNDGLPWDSKMNPYAFASSHYCPNCGAKMEFGGIQCLLEL